MGVHTSKVSPYCSGDDNSVQDTIITAALAANSSFLSTRSERLEPESSSTKYSAKLKAEAQAYRWFPRQKYKRKRKIFTFPWSIVETGSMKYRKQRDLSASSSFRKVTMEAMRRVRSNNCQNGFEMEKDIAMSNLHCNREKRRPSIEPNDKIAFTTLMNSMLAGQLRGTLQEYPRKSNRSKPDGNNISSNKKKKRKQVRNVAVQEKNSITTA